MREIKQIFIHCTASEDSLDIGAKEIRALHTTPKNELVSWNGVKVKGFGWSDIGYHYVIRRNGLVEVGRHPSKIGAHVKNYNSSSIGIVWVGTNKIEPRQETSLLALTRGIMHQYQIDIDNVLGHYEVQPNKTCPNLDMDKVRAELLFTKVAE